MRMKEQVRKKKLREKTTSKDNKKLGLMNQPIKVRTALKKS